MAGRLAGKVVAVSGGSAGIGRAVAERAAADGARVVVGARRAGPGGEVVAAIRAAGGDARFVAMDATDEAGAAALVASAVDGYGRLDGAVNNVGGVRATGPLAEVAAGDWRAELDEIAGFVTWLLSDAAAFVTGAALAVDGGATA